MDIYLTEKESTFSIALSMLPETISYKGSANFQSYEIINLGEIKRPKGSKLLSFSWSGIFPGESRKEASFVKTQHWMEPKELHRLFEAWRKGGTVLVLTITETWINREVILSDFSGTSSGGYGDIHYDVTFVENRELKIFTMEELNPGAKTNETASTAARPAPAETKTYTVKKGDNLWNIAKKFLGKGSRYTELYELNKSTIGNNPNLIYPGQTFTIPA